MNLREAAPGDTDALADLLARSPQRGRMTLAQDRRPDVFARRRPYDDAVTLVADGDTGPVATVTATAKDVLIAGRRQRAAYVFDLAVDPDHRRRGLAARLLDGADRWARARDAGVRYAHVMAGNETSGRVFTSAGYRRVATAMGRVFPVFRAHAPVPAGAQPVRDWEAAADTLRRTWSDHDLFRCLDGPGLRDLWTGLPGWDPGHVWHDGDAVAGLWDYRSVLRSVPTSLAPEVGLLTPVAAAARLLRIPFPRPPRLGVPLGYGLLLGLAGPPAAVRTLVGAALERARTLGLDLVLSFHDARERPAWTGAGFNLRSAYHVMAKTDDARMGQRPVWVDPADL